MPQDRHIWVLDPRVLDYVKFSQFQWWELLAIAAVLAALFSYALLAVFLDRRARARNRRLKRLARLETWLEAWQLAPEEEQALWELAGDRNPLALYTLLADPGTFERAVHQALAGGERLPFTERVREALGYHSDNLGIPIVSTRQLRAGDHFRFAVWEEGRPQHHYGVVTAVSPAGVAVELTDAGCKAVVGTRGESELFFLRGNDVEVRFPLTVRSMDRERNRLLLSHQLVRGGQRARSTRLPMLRPIAFRLHAQLSGPTAEAQRGPQAGGDELVGGLPGREMRGALLEMSEGGFSMVILEPVAEGAYVEYAMPMPRGRTLPIMGRVLDCRPFAGSRWLVRCELRGLLPTQRSALSQMLRLEQQRRIKAMQAERRKRRKEEARQA
jgi:hypothetical protein